MVGKRVAIVSLKESANGMVRVRYNQHYIQWPGFTRR